MHIAAKEIGTTHRADVPGSAAYAQNANSEAAPSEIAAATMAGMLGTNLLASAAPLNKIEPSTIKTVIRDGARPKTERFHADTTEISATAPIPAFAL